MVVSIQHDRLHDGMDRIRPSRFFPVLIRIRPYDEGSIMNPIPPCPVKNFSGLASIIFGLLIVVAVVVHRHGGVAHIFLKEL